ncbi:hypothetical protein K432DRAFT_390263 [Lepidopterella palustris CBS 459.81]|uniref:C2H2-type domain-containing protein n=1 Tax=Lepidopterella palustris CBS 459.81 TaxID=1314670 RepID=A0A8E2JI81_9PEZI|nr:hypothetical protein K432DRAFT_390263 [Lepidopterella palustris CBS 459.81]
MFESHIFFNNLAQAIALLESRKHPAVEFHRKGQSVENRANNLDLEDVLLEVRSVLSQMSQSPSTRQVLEKWYGAKLFKCSRIDCASFSQGFSNLDDCSEHQKKHHRRFHCAFEGCMAAPKGFTSETRLQQHFHRVHDPSANSSFPRYLSQEIIFAAADVKQAIVETDISFREQSLTAKFHFPNRPSPLFEANDHTSKRLWREAINNP